MAAHSQWNLRYLIDQVKAVCEITPDGCWLWRYGTWAEHKYVDEQRKYPKIMIKGVRKHVSEWVALVTLGPKPGKGWDVCHSCDRPPCVNPDHLSYGTHRQNMIQMSARQRSGPTLHRENYKWKDDHALRLHPERRHRSPTPGDYASGDEHYTRRNPELITWQGTNHYRARLDPDKVREIRRRRSEGSSVLARYFGVGVSTVQAVLEGRTWKSVK